jgi:UDP-glucose 4-epimerase
MNRPFGGLRRGQLGLPSSTCTAFASKRRGLGGCPETRRGCGRSANVHQSDPTRRRLSARRYFRACRPRFGYAGLLLTNVRASGQQVIVLGGGFIGAATARVLLDTGARVAVVTRSEPIPRRRRLIEGAELVIADVERIEVLTNLIADADQVVYAVGSSTPAESEADPAGDIGNVLPNFVRVLELIRAHPSTRLTFLSSGGTVYGNVMKLPIPETAATLPISSYGILKLACEHYLLMYAAVHGIDGLILRLSNPYGPGQDGTRHQGVIAHLLRSALTGEAVTLYSWGKTVRDYIYIDDLADLVAQAVRRRNLPPVVNIGSGTGHSTYEVAELAREVTGSAFEIRTERPRGCDVDTNVLDVSVLREHVAFAPRSLREGLADTWASFQETARPQAVGSRAGGLES